MAIRKVVDVILSAVFWLAVGLGMADLLLKAFPPRAWTNAHARPRPRHLRSMPTDGREASGCA